MQKSWAFPIHLLAPINYFSYDRFINKKGKLFVSVVWKGIVMFIDVNDREKERKSKRDKASKTRQNQEELESNDFGNGDKFPNHTIRENMSFDYQVSSRGYRLIAYLIESFLMSITLFIGWFIWSLFTWKEGTTPGHKMIGQKIVVYETGETASWGRMFVREVLAKIVAAVLSIFTFGIPAIIDNIFIFRADKRTLHDLIAGTIVVNDPDIAIFQP